MPGKLDPEIVATLRQALDEAERRYGLEVATRQNLEQQYAVLAHELRTAIGGIMAMTDLLAGSSLSETQRLHVGALQQSGRSLFAIVNNILDGAKLNAGKMSIDPIDCDLRAFAAELAAGLEARAALKSLATEVRVDGDLPAIVRVDPLRLRQITENLIDNAVKFTADGSVTVDIRADKKDGKSCQLHIDVRDTGIGLSKDQIAGLFVPFSQGDNSIARRFGGTGLGLSIVKQLVGLMGGTIAVESEPDHGCTFKISLLLDVVHWQKDDKFKTSPAPQSGSLNVLVVEDNVVNQVLISSLLEGFGMDFKIAPGGQQGIDAYKTGRYDVVLMDIQMPVVSGIDAAKAIRQLQQNRDHVPIIALTAQLPEQLSEGASADLFDGHVPKPIRPDALAQMIASLINQPPLAANG